MLFGTAHITRQALCRCAEDGRSVVYFDYAGHFRARVEGPTSGNVLLRLAQFTAHADTIQTTDIVRHLVAGKIRNQRFVLLRGARDAKEENRAERFRDAAEQMGKLLITLPHQSEVEAIRGIEGQTAALYFEVFGNLITVPEDEFAFLQRSRRPPRDRMNALLSFLYSLLLADCQAACEGIGLDPQIGFLHVPRPGRASLALDLMEEFRPILADRLALSLVNRRQLRPEHFDNRSGGSVYLNEGGRKIVLTAYQDRKKEETVHPLLKDKIPHGLLPHLQARLLARHLRGDLEHYLPWTC
jgi:CRISPR-associated protein Cas1